MLVEKNRFILMSKGAPGPTTQPSTIDSKASTTPAAPKKTLVARYYLILIPIYAILAPKILVVTYSSGSPKNGISEAHVTEPRSVAEDRSDGPWAAPPPRGVAPRSTTMPARIDRCWDKRATNVDHIYVRVMLGSTKWLSMIL